MQNIDFQRLNELLRCQMYQNCPSPTLPLLSHCSTSKKDGVQHLLLLTPCTQSTIYGPGHISKYLQRALSPLYGRLRNGTRPRIHPGYRVSLIILARSAHLKIIKADLATFMDGTACIA